MQELLDNKALINDMLARYGVRFGIYKIRRIRIPLYPIYPEHMIMPWLSETPSVQRHFRIWKWH